MLNFAEKSNNLTFSYLLAKAIRFFTVPPIIVFFLITVLRTNIVTVFKSPVDYVFSLVFLAILPFLAYPASYAIPKIRAMGREGQRDLAFLFNIFGYTLALVYGVLAKVSESLMMIFTTYFLSVLVLTVFNKVLKMRASGHACSICGPLILLIYFIGVKSILPCALLYALVIWASLIMKRHTPKELLLGTFCACVAFFISTFFVHLADSARIIGIIS